VRERGGGGGGGGLYLTIFLVVALCVGAAMCIIQMILSFQLSV